MNKYILKALMCAALAAPVLTSCELDQYPADSLPSEQTWQTMTDAANHRNGLLAALRSNANGYAGVMEAQTDLFNIKSYGTDYQQVHTWTFTTSQFSGDGLWSGSYNLVTNANDILNNIDKIHTETAEQKAEIRKIKAFAYFSRAWAMSRMAVRYCQNYDPATAASTLGLPIVKVVDPSYKPSRSSLAATYEMIVEDIDSAKTHFGDPTNTDYSEPNYNVAEALEARVYLDMKEYDKAIATVNDLLKRYHVYASSAAKEGLANMWSSDYAELGTELIYQPIYTTGERASLYGIYKSYDDVKGYYTSTYVPTQGLYSMYTRADRRQQIYFKREQLMAGSVKTSGYILNKFPGNSELLTSNDNALTTFINMPKPFRTAELYLIAAEASYKKDGTGASYLNTLRQSRGLSAVSHTGEELWQDIKDEWVREFCGEGYRLNCLKRWGEGFTRMAPQSFAAGFLSTYQDCQNLKVSADNYRFVWEIPSQDLQANKNLQRNWPSN